MTNLSEHEYQMQSMMDRLTGADYFGMDFWERMRFYKVPGLSVAVVEDGRIETACFGVRDRENGWKVDAETMFQAASISKVLFAMAVMRLREVGKINLDADIREYLDSARRKEGQERKPLFGTFDHQEHTVTLRSLLSHTAGFNIHGFCGYLHGSEIPSVEQILRGEPPANNVPLFQKILPDTKWIYSGGGYVLAQKAVCDALNMEFRQLMQEWVLSPLGMAHSTFAQSPDAGLPADHACGYDLYDRKLPGGFNHMPELAAAGLWTTPHDLALLGMELMRAVSGQSSFLSAESMGEAMTRRLPGARTGMSLFVPEDNREGFFEHSGSNIGYIASLRFKTGTGKGMVVMLNSSVSGEFRGEMEARVRV